MGLLDFNLDRLDSPGARLGLGLLAAAGPQAAPMSFGQRLAGAMGQIRAEKAAEEERLARRQAQEMQSKMLMLQLDQAQRQKDQMQRRDNYLGALDTNAGPTIQPTMAGALAAGLSPQEFAALNPQPKDPSAMFDKINPKDFTPESINEFLRTGSAGSLRAAPKDESTPSDWKLYELSGAKARGISFDQWDQARRRASATSVSVNTGDRIPTALVKQQDDLIDKMSVARATDTDLGALATQIEGGTLKFGPVRNLINAGKNVAGLSDEESRAFGTFKSTLEKMRNDSLRLNAGVQTEGDAQRAWNELFQNINDTKFVGQRLQEIRRINQRAAQMHEYRLNVLRQNSGAGPLSQPTLQPAVEAGSATVVRTGKDAQGRKVQQMSDGTIRYVQD